MDSRHLWKVAWLFDSEHSSTPLVNGVVSVTVREIKFSSKSHFDNKNGFYSHMKDCVIYHISENSGKIRNQKEQLFRAEISILSNSYFFSKK